MRYTDIRAQLETGDMLLFSGRAFGSRVIQLASRSKYSHVGVVLRDPQLDIVYCWDSTSLGRTRNGPGITPLSDMLVAYKGKVYLRRLHCERTPERLRALAYYRHEIAGRPYERHPLQLARSLFDLFPWDRNKPDLSSIFCSEHVAELYIRWCLLPPQPPSNEYTPVDLAELKILRDGWLERSAHLDL